METACHALREAPLGRACLLHGQVGSWERKVKDCEQSVHAGHLADAVGQLKALRGGQFHAISCNFMAFHGISGHF